MGKTLNSIAAVAVLCALVVFQGGYYAGAVCVIGMVGLLAYIVCMALRKAMLAFPLSTAFLLVIAALLLVSALAHGATVTMLLEAAAWFALAGVSLWCVFESERDKRRMLDMLVVAGAVLSFAGIAMFVGVLPVEGSANAGRLMFTFQYANAAGLFFAVIAVLGLCSTNHRLRFAAALPIVALMLTQSVGAIVVFVFALAVLGIRSVRRGEIGAKPVIATAAIAIAACVAVVVVMPGRIVQASQTFIERVIQMSDGLGLLASNAALGIGPDQWQFAYPAIQTAQYRAADVHCSYLQMALDAGIVAALVLVAMLVWGAIRLFRQGDFACGLGVVMVAAHALFDFDFQFGALVFLAALLMAGRIPVAEEGKSSRMAHGAAFAGKAATALCWIVAFCTLAASCAGVYLDTRAGAVQNASAQGDAKAVASLLDSSTLLGNDPDMQLYLSSALLESADYEGVIAATAAPLAVRHRPVRSCPAARCGGWSGRRLRAGI